MGRRIILLCATVVACSSTDQAPVEAPVEKSKDPLREYYFDVCVQEGYGSTVGECEVWAAGRFLSDMLGTSNNAEVANNLLRALTMSCKQKDSSKTYETCLAESYQHVIDKCNENPVETNKYCGLER